jgi:hypothetical protein
MNKKVCAALVSVALLAGCSSDADVVSENISRAAEDFQIARRIVFVNGITNDYLLSIEGQCNITHEQEQRQLEVTCRTTDGDKKHFLGLSDNVTYFVEQMNPVNVSEDHYKVYFKPATIIPDVDAR